MKFLKWDFEVCDLGISRASNDIHILSKWVIQFGIFYPLQPFYLLSSLITRSMPILIDFLLIFFYYLKSLYVSIESLSFNFIVNWVII